MAWLVEWPCLAHACGLDLFLFVRLFLKQFLPWSPWKPSSGCGSDGLRLWNLWATFFKVFPHKGQDLCKEWWLSSGGTGSSIEFLGGKHQHAGGTGFIIYSLVDWSRCIACPRPSPVKVAHGSAHMARRWRVSMCLWPWLPSLLILAIKFILLWHMASHLQKTFALSIVWPCPGMAQLENWLPGVSDLPSVPWNQRYLFPSSIGSAVAFFKILPGRLGWWMLEAWSEK